ncbi:MAG: recombinase family protein [Mycolicibacterium sp.]|uniref:recombinase family protein n=1 Tax=Mycolicibacterium sp. TaxID=2320850 RepID=UPI000F9936C7|nr:recombinase family protein [Mycolicibacterium sp.]RUP29754.1 MAG: recombinase family protein [Mycolicibacterium sp.]
MSTPGTATRCAVYLRQSLDKTGDELAVSRQRELCHQIVSQRGWTVAGEFVDNSISASDARKNRPGYNALVDAYDAGKFDALVCYDLDRLTRQPRQLEDWIDAAEGRGLALVTANGEADLTTDGGKMYARIKAAVARGEVDRKSARQKASAKQRADMGRPWWPSRPFGYSDNHGTDLHPAEAELLADAYRQVQVGHPLNAIANAWNDAGVKTPKGNIWRGAQVRQVLIAPRNAARRFYDGVDVGEGTWPAIVDVETWRSVVAILENPARRRGATRGRKHLLSGIAVCGECGTPMGSGVASATREKFQVYICKGCFRVSRKASDVDEWVIQHVAARLARPDALTALERRDRPDVAALRAEAATQRARLDELAELIADGTMTAAQFRTANERVKARIAELEQDMYDADAYRVFDGLVGASNPRELFDGLPLARRRAAVGLLMTVTVHKAGKGKVFDPSKVVIEWK